MDFYRREPLPVIYAQLPFVRYSAPVLWADVPEDLRRIEQMKKVALAECCVRTLESPGNFIVKCSLPDDILRRCGRTGQVISWRRFYWAIWDVQWFLDEVEPAEATPCEEAGIDSQFLDSIASDASCIPLLLGSQRRVWLVQQRVPLQSH